MENLMVGGPLDGRYIAVPAGTNIVTIPDVPGAYVRSLLSERVTVFHYKTVAPPQSRWDKAKKSANFPLQPRKQKA